MIEFLIYDLKVAVLLAVFYMFYRLMLSLCDYHSRDGGRAAGCACGGRQLSGRCDRRGECHAPMADRLTCVIYNRYGDNPRTHTLIVIQNHQNH